MPIGPTSGFLDFTNATPRADVIIALSNVGVGTDVPLHALDIRGTANVADIIINNDLTLIGGLTTNTLTINSVSMSTTSNFQQVTNVGDAATTNTVQFTNPTTGFTVSSNAEVGGELSVSGNVEVSSNLTVSGNVGIGTMEPTESLDIVGNLNLQKVSNTASIKLNSNVVTEYVRSKKLIKYPRVAMTAATSGGYTASASSVYNPYGPDLAFDNVAGFVDSNWHSSQVYNGANGAYSGSNSITDSNGKTYSGEHITLQLANADGRVRLHHVRMHTRTAANADRMPTQGVFLGSNDGGTTHDTLHVFAGLSWSGNEWQTIQINASGYYSTYTLVTEYVGSDSWLNIGEIEYHGIPEYDPEAHGTDVIMRSVPNVPNTDWLEVYYDGQDYTSMPSTVTDKSGNGVTGTPNGGVGFDTEYKAFTFDGSGDYIKGAIPSSLSGNHPYTFSLWIKPDAIQSSFKAVFEMGNRANNQSCGLYLNGGSIVHLAFANNLTTSTSVVPNQWIHITGTYTSGSRKVYADGVLLATDAYSSMNIGSTEMTLGANNDDSQEFDGSIANFRLFNRALTKDEIWQLYAYQKDYFQVSPDVVTFKGGRLGVGTSEPRAVLDVKGDVNFHSLLASASGGTETQITDQSIAYKVHSFTSTGTSQITVDKAGFFECLMVAGGGAGGQSNGSGGGGGGVVIQKVFVHTGTYDVVVGTGNTNGVRHPQGTARTYNEYPTGERGGNSSVFGLLAIGGGNGGGDDSCGVDGGSGGGCADDPQVIPGRSVQNQEGSNGYGNRGGYARFNASAGSGGGGAGEPGYDCDPDRFVSDANASWVLLGRDGGNGVGSTIRTGSIQYYGGGGGGAQRNTAPSDQPGAGVGGKGGGGNGGSANNIGSAGSPNTGGGGGGTSSGSVSGGNGGSGIVVVRYKI